MDRERDRDRDRDRDRETEIKRTQNGTIRMTSLMFADEKKSLIKQKEKRNWKKLSCMHNPEACFFDWAKTLLLVSAVGLRHIPHLHSFLKCSSSGGVHFGKK